MSLMHPATRGQPNQRLPTIVLMTDDIANRQKAENERLSSISGTYILPVFDVVNKVCRAVRKYVEAMKDSNQLLDLLSVAGSDDIEPTKAAAGRTAIYPDVCQHYTSPIFTHISAVPFLSDFDRGCESWRTPSRAFQRQSIQLSRGKVWDYLLLASANNDKTGKCASPGIR
jgi:hypothetical protein